MRLRTRSTWAAAAALPLLAAIVGVSLIRDGAPAPLAADSGEADLATSVLVPGLPPFTEADLVHGGNGWQGATIAGPGIVRTSGADRRTPWELLVPSARLRADIVRLSVTADGALGAPDNPDVIGWWELGPRPGEPGNLLLDGHRDYTDIWGNTGFGVCWELGQTQAGDFVLIRDRGSDLVWVYRVTRSLSLPWDDPAGVQFLAPSADPTLTLITCEGSFNQATHNYSKRQIITAALVDTANGASAAPRSLALESGWNLVGWTAPGITPLAGSLLDGLVERAFTWSAAAQAFEIWSPLLPPQLSGVRSLRFGQATWVAVAPGRATTLSLPRSSGGRWVDLSATPQGGFNLVTWTGPDGASLDEASASIAHDLDAIFLWDATAQRWSIYRPGAPAYLSSATTLAHGQALWALVARDALWYQPAP